MHRFRYLKYGLGLILVFVGLKMAWLNDAFGGKFPITWSLGIIGAILATTMTASLVLSRSSAGAPAPGRS
jgi:tellurite resistance protein TerC